VFPDAFEIEDFSKIGIGPIGDVNEIGLDKGFGR
jgi:hypothetical protein